MTAKQLAKKGFCHIGIVSGGIPFVPPSEIAWGRGEGG